VASCSLSANTAKVPCLHRLQVCSNTISGRGLMIYDIASRLSSSATIRVLERFVQNLLQLHTHRETTNCDFEDRPVNSFCVFIFLSINSCQLSTTSGFSLVIRSRRLICLTADSFSFRPADPRTASSHSPSLGHLLIWRRASYLRHYSCHHGSC
jgi:hypothetical protein